MKPLFLSAVVVALLIESGLSDRPAIQGRVSASSIPNERIDYTRFLQIAQASEGRHALRRVTEDRFMKLAHDPGTVILDARSADKYALRHIKGAVNLPFTDFTEESLAKLIPNKGRRVLIYCNNNFGNSPQSFAPKVAPASLNISTYIALATYGYSNVYELGPEVLPIVPTTGSGF